MLTFHADKTALAHKYRASVSGYDSYPLSVSTTQVAMCFIILDKSDEMMPLIANTPEPPYYAVIFTSQRTDIDNGYNEMAARMVELAARQPGFLGVESAREEVGITVSYWADVASIKAWKAHAEHQDAQRLGHKQWYQHFKTRIARVECDYGI